MLKNANQTKKASKQKTLFKKPMAKKNLFYQIGIADDFLCKLSAMKERGSLIISGWRIC